MTGELRAKYWKRNLTYLAVLLSIWFVVSYGCAIIFVDQLDKVRFAGFKLGFWMAQQGTIYIFVVLIFVYTWLMNRLDRECDVHEEDEAPVVIDPPVASLSVGDADADADANTVDTERKG